MTTKEELDLLSPSDRLRMYARLGHIVRGWGPVEEYVPAFFDRCMRQGHLPAGRGNLPPDEAVRPEDLREFAHTFHVLGRWAHFGFNVFELTPSLAAGLLLTDPVPLEGELALPFPCFYIRLPPEIVPIFANGKQHWAEGIWCQRFTSAHKGRGEHTPFFRWTIEYKSLSMWKDRFPSDLDEGDSNVIYNRTWSGDPPVVPEDEITYDKALRIVKNLASWLDATGGINAQERPQAPHLKKKASPEKRQEVASGVWPHVWVFGKNVQLQKELRQAARDFALAESGNHASGWKVSVRHSVRGHFKSQAYGAGNALRRRRWIEPYYRGPEGAAAWAHLYTNKDSKLSDP